MKINFNANNFYHFTVFKHNFIDFVYFSVILGWFSGILEKFWNPRWRIQDGGCFDIMM